MTVAAKLGGFAVLLVIVFGAAFGLGRAVDPDGGAGRSAPVTATSTTTTTTTGHGGHS